MLSESSVAFLKRLLDTPGPSGFESAPAKLWRDEGRAFAEVSNDVTGNSLAVVNPGGSPTINSPARSIAPSSRSKCISSCLREE